MCQSSIPFLYFSPTVVGTMDCFQCNGRQFGIEVGARGLEIFNLAYGAAAA